MPQLSFTDRWITTKNGDHVKIEEGKGALPVREQIKQHFEAKAAKEAKEADPHAKIRERLKLKPKTKPETEKKPPKPKPTRGPMAEARRAGQWKTDEKGALVLNKDGKRIWVNEGNGPSIVMADGSPAPPHIQKLAGQIPPGYHDVKVSTDPEAEVFYTAKDEKGRPKQNTIDSYQARRDVVKFGSTREMIAKHDDISREIQEARHNPKLKEQADATWLMQVQATRVGSDADTKADVKAYGATTLREEHVVVSPQGVRLQFVGKEGIHHDHLIRDEKLGKMLVERKLTADERDGRIFATNDDKTRQFVATLGGGKFTPKDFRTSAATRMARAEVASDSRASTDEKEHKDRIKQVSEKVSKLLGNGWKEARDSYIDPMVWIDWRPS